MTGQNKPVPQQRGMSPIHPDAAAIDIGAKMHVAAVGPDRDPEPVRTFGTFTGDLHRLADWFERVRGRDGRHGVRPGSTGSRSSRSSSSAASRCVLVNARDAKHVPGRKTDVSDAQWLQRLHEYGLLRASFRPKGEIAALRAYLRQRERLLDYAASHIQHMQKALMQMNLQLHHVVSDITGATGMRIIRAIVAGERDPGVLAAHRDRRCHASVETIRQALTGNWREEHLFALAQALDAVRRLPGEGRRLRRADRGGAEARCKAQSAKPVGKLPPARRTTAAAQRPGLRRLARRCTRCSGST